MKRNSPYPQLPIVSFMPDGFRWYLADACWEKLAQRANGILLNGHPGAEDMEILKKAIKRFIFRLKPGADDSAIPSVVIKAFPMPKLKMRLLRYRRYGPAELGNLFEATRRGLPVPRVFGYGRLRRGLLVLGTMIMMEDLAPRQTVGTLLADAEGQPSRQREILDRTLPLFVQLYRKGCNHIDLNPQSIWLSEDPRLDQKISDFHYARFLNQPSPKALVSQAAYFARCCSRIVPEDLFQPWLPKLLTAADIDNSDQWLKTFSRFRRLNLSQAKRLTIR